MEQKSLKEAVMELNFAISRLTQEMIEEKEARAELKALIIGIRDVLYGNNKGSSPGLIERTRTIERWIETRRWIERLVVGVILTEFIGLAISAIIYLASKVP